jgi:hypothetical protein
LPWGLLRAFISVRKACSSSDVNLIGFWGLGPLMLQPPSPTLYRLIAPAQTQCEIAKSCT